MAMFSGTELYTAQYGLHEWMNTFYFANDSIKMDISYKKYKLHELQKIQITWVTKNTNYMSYINQIRLREH